MEIRQNRDSRGARSHRQSDDCKEIRVLTTQCLDEEFHIQQIDHAVLVHVRFGLKHATRKNIDKRGHVQQVDNTVQIDVAQQDRIGLA